MKLETKNTILLWLKRLLFTVLVLGPFIPMVQQYDPFYEMEKLNGSYSETEKPVWTLASWLSGAYQSQKISYTNEQVGFRPDMIRFYNQWHFDLYNQARANDVIIGKEEYLFGKGYIAAYLGKDFLGRELIQDKVNKLIKIRDTLATKNIDIVVLLAPGKASFFNEYLPDVYQKAINTPTNYTVMRDELKRANINCLDFLGWFDDLKATAPYPLFPKTGIHWSKYGEVIAADSILKYLAKLRATPMPWIDTFGFEATSTVRDTDDDIERGMNIFYKIPDLEMGYFNSRILLDSTQRYPKISVVGDSYFWGLVALGMANEGFNHGEFWYYCNEVHHANGEPMRTYAEIDNVIEKIEANEVIILQSTDANLKSFFHEFVDRIYPLYFPSGIKK